MEAKTLTTPGNDQLDTDAAAAILGLSAGTLAVRRSSGRYAQPFVKIGTRVRYRRSDLIAWLEKRTRDNGATA